MRNAQTKLVGLAVGLALCGCGYHLAGSVGQGGLGRVAVHAPRTPSTEGELPRLVADALRREVMRRPGTELVEDPGQADWVLSGKVLPVQQSPSSLSAVVLSLEIELTLALDLRAVRSDGREVRAPRKRLRETERYLASADPEAQRKNRDEALRRAAQLLAARFLDQVAESSLRMQEGPA